MPTLVRQRARSSRRRYARAVRAPSHPRRPSARRASSQPRDAVSPHGRGGTVIFEVWFTSAMTDADLDLLRRRLDMTTRPEQKMRPDSNSPGVARLDHWSGLFLERGANDGR